MAMPPGLNGLLAQRQFAQQEQQGQLGQMTGLLGIQNAMAQQQELQKSNQLKGLLSEAISSGDQKAIMGLMAQIDPKSVASSLMPKQEAYTLTPGAVRFGPDGKQIAAAPMKEQNPSDLSRLLAEKAQLPPGDPRIATYENAIRKVSETAAQIVPKISVNAGATPYFQPIQTGGGVMAFNSRTGQMEPVKVNGAPVVGAQSDPRLQGQIAGARETAKAGVEQSEEVRKGNKRIDQLGAAIGEAEKLLAKNPTGSYAGAAMDMAARGVGVSTESAQTAAKLETLGGWLVANVPRMEGPQSNIDVQNYQTMAAKVGDRTAPVKERQAALATLKSLQDKYKSLNQPASGIDSLLDKYK